MSSSSSFLPENMPATGGRRRAASTAGGGETGNGDPSTEAPGGIKGRIYASLKHAASLITARLSFFGQRAGAAHSQSNLAGGNSLYVENGKVWKNKTHKEVPASNHSLTDVQDYVRELPQSHVVDYTEASQFPQYRSMVASGLRA